MCGFAGIFEYARAEGNVTVERVIAMRETLHHRGPDAEGVWISEDGRVGSAIAACRSWTSPAGRSQ